LKPPGGFPDQASCDGIWCAGVAAGAEVASMAFEKPQPYPFTAGVIAANAPRCAGVYGLFVGTECIFIGEAENIFRGLMQLLHDPDSRVMKRSPTGFTFEVCRPEQRRILQAVLTYRYRPVCCDRPELFLRET
jgi:hypothetical protein